MQGEAVCECIGHQYSEGRFNPWCCAAQSMRMAYAVRC